MSNMFHTLGASLAQEIGKDEVLCRGVLRMAVANSVKSLQRISDPVKTMNETLTYITNMKYRDWKTLIEGPSLSQILTNIGVKDVTAVTDRLMETLVEQQSLFTMEAH
ncbi:MAG: hypothetical protein IPP66_00515 [Anaerolineales bacterium]|nr:hypothetical protein [Anaerolineales bacterium]